MVRTIPRLSVPLTTCAGPCRPGADCRGGQASRGDPRSKVILGPDHPDTFWSMTNLADGYVKLGRKADALKLQEETLTLQKTKLGPTHPDTLASMNNLAMSYAGAGRRQEAAKLFGDAFVLLKAKKGASHPHTLQAMYNVAWIHALMIPDINDHAKQADLAVTLLQQAVDAGFQDVELIKKDTDLDALRDRPTSRNCLTGWKPKLQREKSDCRRNQHGVPGCAFVLFAKQVDTIAELVRMRPTHNDFKNDQVIALSELFPPKTSFGAVTDAAPAAPE